MLTMKYYIATFDHEFKNLVYLSYDEDGHMFSGILQAISFDSFESALNYMLDPIVSQYIDCGCCIVHIADCTVEKAIEDNDMWKKLHDPCYVL